MKKLLIGCMIIGLLFTAAEAKKNKIFDLKEQYFSQTMLKKGQDGYGKEAKYDLPKVIVTTDTRYSGYSYMYGIFTVDLKEPLSDWSVNIKKKNGTQTSGEMTGIRLASNNGNIYFISFNATDGDDTISINDKTFKVERLQEQKLTVSVISKNNIALFKVNGKTFLKSNPNDFGNLEKVEVELNNNRYDDELLALDIYKVK